MCGARLQPAEHLKHEHSSLYKEVLRWLGHGSTGEDDFEIISKIKICCYLTIDRRSDDSMVILLCLLVLFNPASVDLLEDRDKVTRVYDNFVSMLGRYLKSLQEESEEGAREMSAMDFLSKKGIQIVDTVRRIQEIQEETEVWTSVQVMLQEPGN